MILLINATYIEKCYGLFLSLKDTMEGACPSSSCKVFWIHFGIFLVNVTSLGGSIGIYDSTVSFSSSGMCSYGVESIIIASLENSCSSLSSSM
jgi:hypothetical protein